MRICAWHAAIDEILHDLRFNLTLNTVFLRATTEKRTPKGHAILSFERRWIALVLAAWVATADAAAALSRCAGRVYPAQSPQCAV
jgi:hypothetical protein